MVLFRKEKWYNPFSVEINGKDYTIGSIHVFEGGKVIAKQNQGWFGSNNQFNNLSFDCDCVRKNKVDLKSTTAFIVKSCGDFEPRYDLYIPNSAVKLTDAKYDFNFATQMIKRHQKSSVVEGVVFDEVIAYVNALHNIDTKINAIGDALKITYISTTMVYLENKMNDLGCLIAERNETIDKIKSMSVEEIMEKCKTDEDFGKYVAEE